MSKSRLMTESLLRNAVVGDDILSERTIVVADATKNLYDLRNGCSVAVYCTLPVTINEADKKKMTKTANEPRIAKVPFTLIAALLPSDSVTTNVPLLD